MIQANEKTQCYIYFFPPEGIDWRNKKIKGYIIGCNNKQWQCRWLPFPDIVYNRGVAFNNNQKIIIETIRHRFHTLPEIQFINSDKMKKWEVYEKLAKYKEIKSYLPATMLYHQFEDIKRMLAQYSFIFLKSSEGSGGKGVLSIEKQDAGFYIRFYQKGVHQKRFATSFRDLQSPLKRIISFMPDKIVVQQGIRLVKYKGRLLDLRILLVKDKNGIWNAIYNQARVAQKGTVITNLSLGGYVMNYSDIYPVLKANRPRIPADEEIRDICIMIARYIEKEFGSFGEIGMDMAVDETGKVWFLEGNSKPSKLPEQVIEDTEGISPQFLMTLEYARMLYYRSKNEAAISD